MSAQMKTGFRCVFLVLIFLAAHTFASDKAYDQTGTLKFQGGHADFHASSEVDGHTYNSYCYTSPDSVECHEGVDGSYVVEMEDGRQLFISLAYHTGGGLVGTKNPLLDLAISHTGEGVKIRFRLMEHCSILKYGNPCTFSQQHTMLCIPYLHKTSDTNEACYAIMLISSATNVGVPQRRTLPDSVNPAVVTDSQAVKPSPEVLTNSEAAKSSPAAAAAMANTGHPQTPQELAQLVQSGQASKCAVVTMPSGAEVYVDGNKLGVSPVVFVLLKMGDAPRDVTIKLDGYKTVEKTFIPDGKTIPIGLTLEKDSQ